MKFTKEQRLDIGRQVYTGEITSSQAFEKYRVSKTAICKYARLYQEENKLPPKVSKNPKTGLKSCAPRSVENYESLSKDELIEELIKARIREARLKKGYEVKGDGTVILYDNKNIK